MCEKNILQSFHLSLLLAGAALAGGMLPATLTAAAGQQTTFQRVFGVPGTFDPAMVARVKALPPGKRLAIDRDGDGKHDELWFIDTARRHTDRRRPILVRVIDEDGDLDQTGPDLDSDLYLADWRADGVVDSVVDYQDNDGDGDVDEMGIYFGKYQQPWIDKNQVKVWWSRDVGDDNLLWYDVDWSYDQHRCQYRSHFSGDEVFYQFALAKDADRWLNVFEDPFAFYDPDGDGCSEVVVRICAVGHQVGSLRYSVDIDNDAHGRHTHDYDFSITALPRKGALSAERDARTSMRLRGIPVHRLLGWQAARSFAARARWARACLTWDEMNANTEENVRRDPHERWEGIINHGAADFPQVGGPRCSRLNKRNEVAVAPVGPLRLYYDPTDHRLHLKGARRGWLDVDADLDGKVDARYTYVDEDGDGLFDRRRADLDADGQIDFDWKMHGKGVREFCLDFAPLSAFYRPMLDKTLVDSQALIDAARAALRGTAADRPDPVATFFLTKLAAWMPVTRLGARMRSTPAGARFYVDLIRDRLFLALRDEFGKRAGWDELAAAYAAGDYRTAADMVARKLVSSRQPPGAPTDRGANGRHPRRGPAPRITAPQAFRSFTRRLPLRIDNRGGPRRDASPVTVPLREIRKRAPDFNPDQCAVVAPRRWIDWRQIPHQIDRVDSTVGREISFLADVPEDATATFYLYFAPTADEKRTFPVRTGTAEDWVPPNIGWESNRCAYRAYWGQFDFFGKKTEELIYHDIGSRSYHEEVAWGIDALHVGNACGLGGLALYQDDRAWPVRNPAGKGHLKFTKQVLAQGPIRCAVAIAARNIIPTKPDLSVRMLCLIYADHQETEIRARVAPAGKRLTLAPGIVKLPREQVFADAQAGCFGTWGWQQDVIGQIGMGVIVAPGQVIGVRDQPEERHIQCRPSAGGRLRYWLIGDWRRGRQYPVAPTVENWHRELRGLAARLVSHVPLQLGQPEQVR